MALPPFNEVNKALCEALGFDPVSVRRLSIHLEGGGYPVVLVEYSHHWLARHPDALKAFEQYNLVPLQTKAEDVA